MRRICVACWLPVIFQSADFGGEYGGLSILRHACRMLLPKNNIFGGCALVDNDFHEQNHIAELLVQLEITP